MKIKVIGLKGGVGKTLIANYIVEKLRKMNFSVKVYSSEYNENNEKTDFEIYDLGFVRPSQENSENIFVCDKFSLKMTIEYSKLWNGEKFLIINKASPIPKELIEEINLVKGEVNNFTSIIFVPFNGSFFVNENSTEPTLDILLEIIIKKKTQKIVLPFVET
jgi:MinD-like ATPase involved in chromosome partitioning or flagellar assembly